MKYIAPLQAVSFSKNVHHRPLGQPQQSVKHFSLSVTKEDTSNRLAKRFVALKPWQKKNTFAYLLKDCSKSYFRALSTSVEPIFHTEFNISVDVSLSNHSNHLLPLSRITNAIYLSSENCFMTQRHDHENTKAIQPSSNNNPTDSLNLQKDKYRIQPLESKKTAHKKKSNKSNGDGITKRSSQKFQKPQQGSCKQSSSGTARKTIDEEHLVNFKKTQKIISLHMCSWSDAERGDCLMKLLQHCGHEELLFLADWIRKMKTEHLSINSLPKKVLYQIFLNLDSRDLRTASMVCHEWQLAVVKSGAWKAKCKQLVSLYGMENVYTELEDKENQFSIDWKQVFVKIKEAIDYFSHERNVNEGINEARIPAFKTLSNTNKSMSSIIDKVKNDDPDQTCQPSNEESSLIRNQDFQSKHSPCDPLINNSVEMLSNELHNVLLQSDANTPVSEIYNEQHLTQCQTIEDTECLDEEPTALETRSVIQQTKNIVASFPDSEVYDFESIDIGGLQSLKKVRLIKAHHDAVSTLQCDSRRIFSGSTDHQVRLWDIRSGKLISVLKGHKGGIRSLCFDKTIVASASWDTTIIIWDIIKFCQIVVLFGHRGAVTCVTMNSSIIASGSADNTIKIWDRESWGCSMTLSGHKGEITQVVVVEEHLLSSSQDRTLKLWCLKTQSVVRTFYGHSTAILDAKVYGKLIASSSVNGHVLFWDFDTGHCEAEIHVHSSQVHCLSFHLLRFFTGSGDGVIREWDIETCTCLRSFKGHNSPIMAISIVSSKIVSGSADGMIRIWDLENRVQQVGGKYNAMNENMIEGSTIYESGLIPKIDMKLY